MDLFRQYAEHRKTELMKKAAEKMGGKIEDRKIALSGDAMEREYGGQAFISKALNDVGIKAR